MIEIENLMNYFNFNKIFFMTNSLVLSCLKNSKMKLFYFHASFLLEYEFLKEINTSEKHLIIRFCLYFYFMQQMKCS